VGTYEQHVIMKKLKEGKATEKDLEYLKHLAKNSKLYMWTWIFSSKCYC